MKYPEPQTIHYSQLPPLIDGDWLKVEYDGRLITEGREGQHVLIKGSEIIGYWSTHQEAMSEGHRRYPLQPFFVHEIQTNEPLNRMSIRLKRLGVNSVSSDHEFNWSI
jgi:hypothetical protein